MRTRYRRRVPGAGETTSAAILVVPEGRARPSGNGGPHASGPGRRGMASTWTAVRRGGVPDAKAAPGPASRTSTRMSRGARDENTEPGGSAPRHRGDSRAGRSRPRTAAARRDLCYACRRLAGRSFTRFAKPWRARSATTRERRRQPSRATRGARRRCDSGRRRTWRSSWRSTWG